MLAILPMNLDFPGNLRWKTKTPKGQTPWALCKAANRKLAKFLRLTAFFLPKPPTDHCQGKINDVDTFFNLFFGLHADNFSVSVYQTFFTGNHETKKSYFIIPGMINNYGGLLCPNVLSR
jgi:hypothetical protein